MDDVIEHAAALARHHDAVLHGFYVVDTSTIRGLAKENGIDETLEAEGEEALDHIEEIAGDGVRVERSIVQGSPSSEIVDYADKIGADLIVMGTKGRGGVDRMLLGSVAERVVRMANVPVTTISVD
jgi:nucleotide-binding universal stress UspA family protein